MSSEFEQALHREGRVVMKGLDRAAYRAIARSLGDVLGEEAIALRPGAHAYVAKRGRVPLHTDHPQVDVVGWLCEAQDEVDGASLLLDLRPLVGSLNEYERDLLRCTHLACPPLAGGPPTGRWPVLRATPGGDAVFCSPWLRAVEATAEQTAALERFRASVSAWATHALVEVRLSPGDAVFIDNRRILHGRRAIAESSHRRLLRLWLRRPPRYRADIDDAIALEGSLY